MTKVADVLLSVFPSDDSEGVTLTDTVRITFTEEIDETTLEHEGFILEGPDTDEVIHNVYIPTTLVAGSETRILESPGYQGIAPGAFTFLRLDPISGDPADILDTTGDGTLYRTRLIFKPSVPLAPDTEYTIYLVGDEDLSDGTEFGIKPRTVFDGVADGANTGNGTVFFGGSYTGTLASNTLHIRITKAGAPGIAEYEWWLASTPLDLGGPNLSSTGKSTLTNGINVRFDVNGILNLDDEFSVFVKKQSPYETTVSSTFVSGGGSIEAVPTTAATSPLGDPVVALPSTADIFTVAKITPADLSTNLKPDEYGRITLEFSHDVDPLTVSDSTVHVLAEPVIDHPNLSIVSPDGEVAKTITTSGHFIYIDL